MHVSGERLPGHVVVPSQSSPGATPPRLVFFSQSSLWPPLGARPHVPMSVFHAPSRRDCFLGLSLPARPNPRAHVARNNLRIKPGDLCSVHACHDIKYGKWGPALSAQYPWLALAQSFFAQPLRRHVSKRRDTVPICLSSTDVDEGKIQLNKVARNNLRIKLGDLCSVHGRHNIEYGKRIHVLPFDDSIEGLSGNLFDVYLKPVV
ncbi:hypothetical protein EXIGLDRAFT_772672 [Exidia glandulosa HHB12029]|uniref:CDC48 N-terminal subdomain domain-containing protein n=1 Tax=Exidia glandulosa HHB12029 TaxID=1314781 RepID=A0A165F6Q1_EXIGL|nr:hypothetical protein EXIGLDRAFT_772672 [Exidia glandulosa HHB12029]